MRDGSAGRQVHIICSCAMVCASVEGACQRGCSFKGDWLRRSFNVPNTITLSDGRKRLTNAAEFRELKQRSYEDAILWLDQLRAGMV